MRRILATAVATIIGGTAAVVVSAGPAEAVNVRYRAANHCTVDGHRFDGDIHTWGKPTPSNPGVMTEVQQWGYRWDTGVNATFIEGREVVWRDGAWQDAGSGVGWVNEPITDNKWHNASKQGGPQYIGYILPDRPTAILIRAYVGAFDFCRIILRPADLYYVG